MPRILVVGSRKAEDPAKFQQACKWIGEEFAERGYTIVAAGVGDDDAERWVIEGADGWQGTPCEVVPYQPAGENLTHLLVSDKSRWKNVRIGETIKPDGGNWAVGQAAALFKSDAALLIGGGILTANVGYLAMEVGVPVFAIERLGGDAQSIAKLLAPKHREMRMSQAQADPDPTAQGFGKKVGEALSFLMKRTARRREVRETLWRVGIAAVAFAGLLAYLPGDVAKLVTLTAAGALFGVVLVFQVRGRTSKDAAGAMLLKALSESGVAVVVGALYALFLFLLAGDFNANLASLLAMPDFQMKTLLVGVGVGAFLGPSTHQLLDKLRGQ